MNKQDFVEKVAIRANMSKVDAKNAVESVLAEIQDSLVNGDGVSFIGFGSFVTSKRAARTARVPGTDKTVELEATTVAKFKVGKSLKTAVSGK